MFYLIFHTLTMVFAAFFIGILLGYWLKSCFNSKGPNFDAPSASISYPSSDIQDVEVSSEQINDGNISPEILHIPQIPNAEVETPSSFQNAVSAPSQLGDIVKLLQKPICLETPRNNTPDDLKQISGIGPANEKKLNTLGIYHLDQIAVWNAAEIEWMNDYLGFAGRVQREDWVNQAKSLCDKNTIT